MLFGATEFAITDTKLYVPFATLSTQNKAKLLEQLKSGLKEQLIGTNINQKKKTQLPKPYLDYLIDPSFQ